MLISKVLMENPFVNPLLYPMSDGDISGCALYVHVLSCSFRNSQRHKKINTM